MKRWTLSIALYLFLVFASGVAVGVFGYRLYSGTPVAAKISDKSAPARMSPEEWRRQYIGEMQSRVKLTPDQLQQLNTILDATHARFHEERGKHDLVIKQIRDEQVAKVRAMLTPEQLPEYEKLRAERDQRAKAAGRK